MQFCFCSILLSMCAWPQKIGCFLEKTVSYLLFSSLLFRIKLFILLPYLVSYLLLFVWLCAVYVCVYELLAIKYIESQPNFHRSLCECVLNCLLLYLESFGLFFFLIFQTTLVLVHHAHHSRPEERKKFDYKTNRFLCLFLVLCIQQSLEIISWVVSVWFFCSLVFSFLFVERCRRRHGMFFVHSSAGKENFFLHHLSVLVEKFEESVANLLFFQFIEILQEHPGIRQIR